MKHCGKRQKELSFGRRRLTSGSPHSLASVLGATGMFSPARALAVTHRLETPMTAEDWGDCSAVTVAANPE